MHVHQQKRTPLSFQDTEVFAPVPEPLTIMIPRVKAEEPAPSPKKHRKQDNTLTDAQKQILTWISVAVLGVVLLACALGAATGAFISKILVF